MHMASTDGSSAFHPVFICDISCVTWPTLFSLTCTAVKPQRTASALYDLLRAPRCAHMLHSFACCVWMRIHVIMHSTLMNPPPAAQHVLAMACTPATSVNASAAAYDWVMACSETNTRRQTLRLDPTLNIPEVIDAQCHPDDCACCMISCKKLMPCARLCHPP